MKNTCLIKLIYVLYHILLYIHHFTYRSIQYIPIVSHHSPFLKMDIITSQYNNESDNCSSTAVSQSKQTIDTHSPNLSSEEYEDIMNAIRDYAETYLEENAIHMSKPDFHSSFIQDVFKYVKVEGKQECWFSKASSSSASSDIIQQLEIMHGEIDIIVDEDNVTTISDIDADNNNDEEEDDEYDDYWREIVNHVCTELYNIYNIPHRETVFGDYKLAFVENHCVDVISIEATLKYLDTLPVQKQRSEEWYRFRHDRFSASNIWQLFSTLAQFNSIIYEKCKPLEPSTFEVGSFDSGSTIGKRDARSWGIKYEPLTVMLYEYIYKTMVKSDYGCIAHSNVDIHIGASPDGINVDRTNVERFGRMVEVKNIYNREITGIPPENYWTQMQVQMEVCNLQECDFVETRFKEYESRDAFVQSEDDEQHDFRGAVLWILPINQQTNTNNHKSMYLYSPVQYHTVEDVDKWVSTVETEYATTHAIYEINYWYLHQFSCTLVKRNEMWFSSTIDIIKNSWKTVEVERKNGFEHRAPQRRTKKKSDNNTEPIKCLINIPTIVVHKSAAGEDIDRTTTIHGIQNPLSHLHTMDVIPDNVSLIKLN